MPQSLRRAVAVLTLIALQGCYHSRVITDSQAGTEYTSQTVNSFFWGMVQENVQPPNCVESNAMQEVRVNWNYGYSFITVFTLGIWAPMEVEWRCAKLPPPPPNEQ